MITIEQCRAARGLLDWTQQDLAAKSGLSKTAINNFEKGYSHIKADSLQAIRLSFEEAGVEFIDLIGVTQKTENARILKGHDAFADLIRDIEKSYEGELLVCHVDHKFPEESLLTTISDFLRNLEMRGIPMRVLGTRQTSEGIRGARFLPADNMASSNTLQFLYGQKAAFILLNSSTVIILDSSKTFEDERRHFERLWDEAGFGMTSKTSSKLINK